jgi:hypothetical protein
MNCRTKLKDALMLRRHSERILQLRFGSSWVKYAQVHRYVQDALLMSPTASLTAIHRLPFSTG